MTSSPSISICPEVKSSSPAIIRSSVDLPQPDGPTKTANSPSSIVRSKGGITCVSPKLFVTLLSTMRPIIFPYFTAPKVKPWTSCFWQNHPNTTMGPTAAVDTADKRPKNNPSGALFPSMSLESVAASIVVSRTVQ